MVHRAPSHLFVEDMNETAGLEAIFGEDDEDGDDDSDDDDDSSDSSDSSTDNEVTVSSDSEFNGTEIDETEASDDSDEEEESDGEDCRKLHITPHPEVLEPSILIKKCPGIPDLMKHRGYRLCGDNIDKSIHTRHMRLDRRNKSLHYFHLYAVENRVDFASLSDELPDNSKITNLWSVAKSLLPTPADDEALKKNISTLISRVLCKHVKFFKLSCEDMVKQHLQHRFYEEMSSKSVVVSLELCVSKYLCQHNFKNFLIHLLCKHIMFHNGSMTCSPFESHILAN